MNDDLPDLSLEGLLFIVVGMAALGMVFGLA